MTTRSRLRVSALAASMAVVTLVAVPARAAGKTVHITKSDSGGTGVAGATFTLYVDAPPVGGGPPKGAEDTVVQGTCTTGANGQCDITGVPPGDYWVSETGPPAGYVAASDSTLKVKKGKRKVFEVVVVDDKKPTNVSVNDPTGDENVGDGTHIFQFGPAVAVSPNGKQVFVAFNDSAGLVSGSYSGIGVAYSGNGGATFEDLGKVPPNSGQTFILAQPSTIYDPQTNRFIVAADGVVFADDLFRSPILVSIFDPATGGFGDPVNTFPDIPPDPFSAHDPSLAVDPNTGNLYLAFTVSNGSTQNEGFFTRSTNGGKTWKTPFSVTGPGTNDFITPAVAPNGDVYVAWTDFGGSATTTDDFFIARSMDGGRTFSDPFPIATDVPKSGTPTSCGGSQQYTYLGKLVTADAPEIVVDPTNPNRVRALWTMAGSDGDISDIVWSTSSDGGKTWSPPETLLPSEGTQMFPAVAVTPDGRVAVTYYEAASPPQIDYEVSVYDGISDLQDLYNAPFPVNDAPFPSWNTLGPYDTNYTACFGMQGNQFAAPGSGFYMAWADGGDPGPAANGGVDPNIDFARFDGGFLVTTTSVSVRKGGSTITVRGAVDPPPVLDARVTVTLFVDDDVVDRGRPSIDAQGGFDTTFSRPGGGTCKVVVRFGGSEGRMPSSATKTFDC